MDKHILQRTAIILTLLIALIFPQKTNRPIDPDTQILFSYQGGGDVYKEGSKTGFMVQIPFFGKAKVYTLYYQQKARLEKKVFLTAEQTDSLISYFEKSNFSDYPNRLPLTNRMFWPISSASLGFRKTEEDSLKVVSAMLTADHKYYPKDFFKLLKKVRRIINEVIKD